MYMSEQGQAPITCELEEELQQYQAWKKRKPVLQQQLSMCGTAPGDLAWERRRRQILRQERKKNNIIQESDGHLTDEDLNELRGCIELGFGFNEEDGQKLCNTLPALDLYFAVNRRLSPTPTSSPHSRRSASFESTGSNSSSTIDSDSWKILSPGDDPAHVKTKLRHWAQAVACSVMQSK